MKFYCKNCEKEFEQQYEELRGELNCPNCNHKDIMMNFVQQGLDLPNTSSGISYLEFEDVLEEGNVNYLERFFKDEFNYDYSRQNYDVKLIDKTGTSVNLEKTYQKTQTNQRLQRIIYNIYYLLLQDL